MPELSDAFRDKLYNAVMNLKEELVKETAQILTFETISGGKTEEEKGRFQKEIAGCLHFLKALCERHGLVYRDLDGVVSVIEQPGESGEKGLGIPLHIDVVPVSGEWKYPPFSGTVAEDTVWGRGTQDDKGPLMACLYAIIALKKLGVKFLRPIHIVMGRGEEVGHWADVQYFIQKEGAPAFSFTPDAMFPIINGEKGIMNLRIDIEWDLTRSDQGLRFFSLFGGTRANVVPDKAQVLLEWEKEDPEALEQLKTSLAEFAKKNPGVKYTGPELCKRSEDQPNGVKILFQGKSAHGSLPEQGHNAILDAVHFLSQYDAVFHECRKYCEFLYVSCSKFFGEGLNIFSEHPFVGKTTVNLGVCKIDSQGGRSQINIRPTLGFSCKEVAERASKLVKEYAKEEDIKMFVVEAKAWGREPLFVDPEKNSFFISSLQTAYNAVTGRKPELQAIGGTTFAKAYPNCVSFGPVEPAEEEEMAHMTDEHVKIPHLLRNTKIYAYAIALLTTDAK